MDYKNLINGGKNAAKGLSNSLGTNNGDENTASSMGDAGRTAGKAARGAARAAKAGKVAAAAGSTGGIGGILVAIKESSTLKKILLGVILTLVFFCAILPSALPEIIWNQLFHIDANIDPVLENKYESSIDKDKMTEKEAKWASIIEDHMTDSYDNVLSRIEKACSSAGVSFEGSKENIIDSTDFAGTEAIDGNDEAYQNEQLVYDRLKKKGYSIKSALAAMATMSCLTSSDVTYGMENSSGSSGYSFLTTDKSAVGAFMFNRANFYKWVKSTYKDKSESKIKTRMLKAETQAEYLDYLIQKKLGSKKKYNKFIKEKKNIKNSITVIVNTLGLSSSDADNIFTKQDTLKSKHYIATSDVGTSKESLSDSNTKKASSSTTSGVSRAKDKLKILKAKDSYNSKTIKAKKTQVLATYKKKKSTVDKLYKTLVQEGLSPAAAAGLLGNAYVESTWRGDVTDGSGGGGTSAWGLCQWQGGRYTSMKSWIKKKGGKWTDITWQAKYAVYELKSGSEKNSFRAYANNVNASRYVTDKFLKTGSVGSYEGFASCDSILQTMMNYACCIERPSNGSSFLLRYAAAEVILEQCGGITVSDSEIGSISNSGAGSRQMALILSAFSVKEDQLFPVFSDKDLDYSETSDDDSSASGSVQDFMNALDKIGREMTSAKFRYRSWGYHKTFAKAKKTSKTADCVQYVCWALKEAGIMKDSDSIFWCHGKLNRGKSVRKNSKLEIIQNGGSKSLESLVKSGKLKPGDIVGSAYSEKPHTMVFKEKKNGKYYFYSVGGSLNQHKVNKVINNTRKGSYKIAVIIRIKGSSTGSAKKGINGAIKWAKSIANNNSFKYVNGYGKCYYCNGGQKAYVCTTFVRAAFAHGAGDKNVEKICKANEGGMATIVGSRSAFEKALLKTKSFKWMGVLKVKDLKPGDVLSVDGHCGIYLGNGVTAEAHNEERGITYDKNTSLLNGKARVLRYVGEGNGSSGSLSESVSEWATSVFDNIESKINKKWQQVYRTVKIAGVWYQEVQRHLQPEQDLRACLNNNDDKLYDIVYGDIVTNSKGQKVYASIEIKPASARTIISSVFGMDPDAIYQTEDGQVLGGKDTTVEQATTTLADSHMEMLYGNHSYGSTDSSEFSASGSSVMGSPLPKQYLSNKYITSFVGKRSAPIAGATTNHGGIDFGVPTGTDVYAALAGKVTYAGTLGNYGNMVEVTSPGGKVLRYAHLSKINTKVGRRVQKGQKIAESGNTGNSTGPHLHFEYRVKGKIADPYPLLFKGKKSGVNS